MLEIFVVVLIAYERLSDLFADIHEKIVTTYLETLRLRVIIEK